MTYPVELVLQELAVKFTVGDITIETIDFSFSRDWFQVKSAVKVKGGLRTGMRLGNVVRVMIIVRMTSRRRPRMFMRSSPDEQDQ